MSRKDIIGHTLIAGWLASLGAALAFAQTPAPAMATVNPEAPPAVAAPTPVRLRDHILFEVSTPIGTLTPLQRAAATEQRLRSAAEGPASTLATLRTADSDGFTGIYAGPVLIRAVTDGDAAHTGRTREQLAADELLVIRQALAVEYRERGTAHVLRGLLFATGATVLLVALLIGLRCGYRWTRAQISRVALAWHWQSSLARLKLLSPSAVANASHSFAAGLAWVIVLLLVYFYLEFVLSLFLSTRGLADRMVAAAEHAVEQVFSALFGYLPSLINIVIIVVVARFILKAVRGLFEQIAAKRLTITNFHPDWGLPTYSLVRFFVIAIAAVMVFPYLPGSGSAGFKGVATFVALAISFGGAPAIANIIAGIILTYMRPFGLGDRVKIADAVGDIMAKNLLLVRLRTIKNVDISIPNSLVLANHIINYSTNAKEAGVILHTTVTIGYDAPWKTVHELLIRAATRVDGLLAEPAPYVLQTSLDDFYVAYEINAYTNRPNEMTSLYSRLHEEIQNAFNEGGVEILSPHYVAMRDGNAMGVPSEYLPKDYQAPGFTIFSRVFRPESVSKPLQSSR
jgi:small-conductance mechanosensitive channel